jgi:uncharacterized membrane-anchored protein
MFFRTLKLFIIILVVSALSVWLSKNAGELSVEWLGYRVTTSAVFAIIFMAAVFWILGRILGIVGFLRRPFGKIQSKKAKTGSDEVL